MNFRLFAVALAGLLSFLTAAALATMLALRASFELLGAAVEGGSAVEPLGEFVTAAGDWQRQHGYENTWWWPHLDEVLRKLDAPEINAVLDTRFDPFATPKLMPGESPFQYVARARLEKNQDGRSRAALNARLASLKKRVTSSDDFLPPGPSTPVCESTAAGPTCRIAS